MRKDTTNVIRQRPGEEPYLQEVTSWQPGVPGLRVTEHVNDPGTFNVTHAGSGLKLNPEGFPTKEDARRYAREAGALADWTQDADTLLAVEGLGGKLRALTGDEDPGTEDPDPFGVGPEDSALLQEAAEVEGYDSVMAMVECFHLLSVVPGVCVECAAVSTRCEPDLRQGWCWECEGQTVASILVLAGLC